MNVFVLFGVIDDYSPYEILGVFDSLESSREGRKQHMALPESCYERYDTHEAELNKLYEYRIGKPNQEWLKAECVDTFMPHRKGPRRHGKKR